MVGGDADDPVRRLCGEPDEGEALAGAGADFIAFGENIWRDARAVAAAASLGTEPVR